MKSYEERLYVYMDGPYTVTRNEKIVGGTTSTYFKIESLEDFETFTIPEHRMNKLFDLMNEAVIKE